MKSCFIITLIVFLPNFITSSFDNEINLECRGEKYGNVTLTAYYPDYNDEDHEKGYVDAKGKDLKSLQDYLDNRADYVTLAMDDKLNLTYGTMICIPELNLHYGHRINLEVRDSSIDLQNSGFTRADICVRSEIDSYDVTVNRKVTLVITGH